MYVLTNHVITGPPALTVNIMKNTESSSIVVQWDKVDDSFTTTYIVTWTSERDHILHHVNLIEQSSYTITGLTLDTVYTITFTASNVCGDGPEYRTSVSLTTDAVSSISTTTTVNGINSVITTSTVNLSTITAMINYSTSTTTTIGVTNPNSMTTPVTDSTTVNAMTSVSKNHDTTTGIVISSSVAVMSTAINNYCTTTTNIVVSCMSTATVGSSADTTSKLRSICNITVIYKQKCKVMIKLMSLL